MPTAPPPIPGYRLDSLLGRGGFGVVWAGHQEASGHPVAIKVLHRVLDERAQTQFHAEIQVMGTLGWHPNIVPLVDAGTTDEGQPYLVMQRMSGSLGERLAAEGPLPPEVVLRHMAAAASGLQAAHNAGLLHRDLKPDNLLLDADGTVRVSDFGVALAAGAADGTRGTTGTLAYAAPELLGGASPSVASDVYALGATMFALLTGDPAFHRDTDESAAALILRAYRDPVPDLRPAGVPDPVARVVERAMAKQPADRPAGAQALHLELAGAAAAVGASLPQPTSPGRPSAAPAAALPVPAPAGGLPDQPSPSQRARAQRVQRVAGRVTAVAAVVVALSVFTFTTFLDRDDRVGDSAVVGDPAVQEDAVEEPTAAPTGGADAAPPPEDAAPPQEEDEGADEPDEEVGAGDDAEAEPPPVVAAPDEAPTLAPGPAPAPAPPPPPPAPPSLPFTDPQSFPLPAPARAGATATVDGITLDAVATDDSLLLFASQEPQGGRSLSDVVGVTVSAAGVAALTADGLVHLHDLDLTPGPVLDLGASRLADTGDSLLALTPRGVVRIAAGGRTTALTEASAGALVSGRAGVLWVADGMLLRAVDVAQGVALARIQLPAPARAVAALSDGRVAIATDREVLLADSTGTIAVRAEVAGVDSLGGARGERLWALVGDAAVEIAPDGTSNRALARPATAVWSTDEGAAIAVLEPPEVFAVS